MKNNSIVPENPSVKSLRKRPTKTPIGGNKTESSGPSYISKESVDIVEGIFHTKCLSS